MGWGLREELLASFLRGGCDGGGCGAREALQIVGCGCNDVLQESGTNEGSVRIERSEQKSVAIGLRSGSKPTRSEGRAQRAKQVRRDPSRRELDESRFFFKVRRYLDFVDVEKISPRKLGSTASLDRRLLGRVSINNVPFGHGLARPSVYLFA